ncbi:MAG: hypothetical protein JRC77_03590 [Deltaproteobacteria bacterium]|nr:hypothetical protein [Deltaproteobacteria bacterium]
MFREAEMALSHGKLNKALRMLRKRFKHLKSSPETRGLIYGFPKADAICQEIGTRVVEETRKVGQAEVLPEEVGPALDVYLASTLTETGGHTGLVGDLVRASGNRKSHLLLTLTNGKTKNLTDEALSRTAIRRENIECCQESSLLGKLKWLVSRLEELNAHRVFLLHHPDDVVAASAIVPSLANQFFFVHHADDRPALGLHASGTTHFDLTPFRYHYCRSWVGIGSNFYLPLTCPDRHARNPLDWKATPGIQTTASSGSPRKFSMEYRPDYAETVVCLLQASAGRHVHIGTLSSAMLDQIHTLLDEAEIPRDRFHHVQQVESLWQAMLEWEVDLYINSFPTPGARASVEVMGSGTPVLWHVRSEQSQYEDTHMAYPEAFCWKDLAELRQHVSQADAPWLVDQSCAARQQYERLHNPKGWEQIFAGATLGPEVSPPSFEDYQAWSQSQRFREQWEAYSLLRERLGLRNPLEPARSYGRVGRLFRALVSKLRVA